MHTDDHNGTRAGDGPERSEEPRPEESLPDAQPELTLDQDEDQLRRARERSGRQAAAPEVAGYEVGERLGRGAFGEVWRAVQLNTGRMVAIKVYTRNRGLDWPLLKREVGKLQRVQAERRIVQLLAVGWDADPPFYIMEHAAGGSLADLLDGGPLTTRRALPLFVQIAKALAYLHGKAVIHCDLKPSNVLLDEDGRPRLADFGQARLLGDADEAVVGTLFYLAPELAETGARPDVRSDIYSLGALLFAMLVGRPPYADEEASRQLASTTTVSDRIARYREMVTAAPPPREHRTIAGVDGELAAIIDRCLARAPEDRYDNVQQVLNALEVRRRRRQQRPLLWSAVIGPAALFLLLLVVGAVAWKEARLTAREALIEQSAASDVGLARVMAEVVDHELEAFKRRVEREAQRVGERVDLLAAGAAAENAETDEGLKELLERLHRRYRRRSFSGWVVADRQGVIRGCVPESAPEDRCSAWGLKPRTAAGAWLLEDTAAEAATAAAQRPALRRETGLSPAVAVKDGRSHFFVASPVSAGSATGSEAEPPGEPAGVLAAVVELTELDGWLSIADLERAEPDQESAKGCSPIFAVLVNSEWKQLLRHPCLAVGRTLPVDGYTTETVVAELLAQEAAPWKAGFVDPALSPPRTDAGDVGAAPSPPDAAEEEEQVGLAAFRKLKANPDWVVIVLRQHSAMTEPLERLAASLKPLGITVVTLGAAGLLVLWLVLALLRGSWLQRSRPAAGEPGAGEIG